MLVEFSIVPLGVGASLSKYIAEVLKVIDESGIPYKITPMGTCLEGEWDEIFPLIKKCRELLLEKTDRVLLHISVDDRKGMKGRLEGKVRSVEEKIGKVLKK
ncbi:MAG: thiamine-binding protein [Nitrospirae bacterium]|nr:MAG: thiamine-binding protein [Nitrospirota bacterium]